MPEEAAMVPRGASVMIGTAIAPVGAMPPRKPHAFPRVSAGVDSGKSVSLLLPVKRAAPPRATPSGESPSGRDRRAPARGSRGGWRKQDRPGNHGVPHHEQGPLVPFASATGDDRRNDGRRQGQRGE